MRRGVRIFFETARARGRKFYRVRVAFPFIASARSGDPCKVSGATESFQRR